MPVLWRELFNEIRVEWIDRGPNVGKGNINIKCPFCGNQDRSHHLGVAERKDAYFCYRDPDRHSGRSLPALLIKLGVSHHEVDRLLTRYRVPELGREEAAPEVKLKPGEILTQWRRFIGAENNGEALDYLEARGFGNARRLCQRFGLRSAIEGIWCNRLLMPLHISGGLVGWTGRGLRMTMSPKYITHSPSENSPIYAPIPLPGYDRQKLVIVEGPFDALKLAAFASEDMYRVAALAGKFLNPPRVSELMTLVGDGCRDILLALDKDVNITTAMGIKNELAMHFRSAHIQRAKLPSYADDPAEILPTEIPGWLHEQFSNQ